MKLDIEFEGGDKPYCEVSCGECGSKTFFVTVGDSGEEEIVLRCYLCDEIGLLAHFADIAE